MITVVSAFVPIPGHPRPAESYHELGDKLRQINHEHMMFDFELPECWLAKFLTWRGKKIRVAAHDNPEKNTLDYHVVQAQKTEWLWYAAMANPRPDVFVWIDYGIFSIPGVTVDIIDQFLDRAQHEQTVAIPGCWDPSPEPHNPTEPNWRFCGGCMIVPRCYTLPLDVAMKNEYMRFIERTNLVNWEVNTLANVERRRDIYAHVPIWFYKADHNASMFTNYQGAHHDSGNSRRIERGNDPFMSTC
jgi:hypothetical protein